MLAYTLLKMITVFPEDKIREHELRRVLLGHNYYSPDTYQVQY